MRLVFSQKTGRGSRTRTVWFYYASQEKIYSKKDVPGVKGQRNGILQLAEEQGHLVVSGTAFGRNQEGHR